MCVCTQVISSTPFGLFIVHMVNILIKVHLLCNVLNFNVFTLTRLLFSLYSVCPFTTKKLIQGTFSGTCLAHVLSASCEDTGGDFRPFYVKFVFYSGFFCRLQVSIGLRRQPHCKIIGRYFFNSKLKHRETNQSCLL